MLVSFLGTNGWFDSPTGNTICTMLDTEDRYVVLDAGMGIHRLDRYMHRQKPVDLYLSHYHLDHLAGLHCIMKFLFVPQMRIFGQKGTQEVLDRFMARPLTLPLKDLPYPTEVIELEEGEHDLGYPVECLPMNHSDPCFGYRFLLGGKSLAYCTDTGENDNIVRLGREADLLITECAFRPGEENPRWPHLNPAKAIALAKRAGSKRLALTHFDAQRYSTLEERKELLRFQQDFPHLTICFDGTQIRL